MQRPGDFYEINVSVVDLTTIRVALALVQCGKAHIHDVDVSKAFLYGNLEETVCMEQPAGFHTRNMDQVLLLKKSLYGLKQAPRVWHMHLANQLSKLHFKTYNYAQSAFVRTHKNSNMQQFIYVDDMLQIYDNLEMLKKVNTELAEH